MDIEELLKLPKEKLIEYCMSLETTDEDGWQEVEREEDGYFREGSKWVIYYYQVEWERDGYLLSYQFNEHSDHDSLYLLLNEIEPGSVYLRKKDEVEVDKKIIVLDYLFRAKKELEDSKIKEEQHALGYINEAIKWIQTITGDYNKYKDNEHQIFINEESYCNIVVEKFGKPYFKGNGFDLLNILLREKYRLIGKYVKMKDRDNQTVYKIINTFPYRLGSGKRICGAEVPLPTLCELEEVNTGKKLDGYYYEDELIYENN